MCALVRRETQDLPLQTAEERNARQRRVNEAGDSHVEFATCSCQTRSDAYRSSNPAIAANAPRPQSTQEPRTTASCCAWFRSTDNSSSRRALPNYANSTVPPVFSVTQSGRGDVSAAATARATPGIPSTRALFRTASIATSLSQNATSSCSPIFAEPQQWQSHVGWSLATPRPGQKALMEPSVAINPGPCCADIGVACCWLGFEKLQQLWETGEISEFVGRVLRQQQLGPLHRRKRIVQPPQRGKKACALTARGSISKAMKGLVGGAAQGSADCRKNWTAALISRSSGSGTHPTSAECAEAAHAAWGGGRYKAARSAPQANVKNFWTQSSPSLVLGRGSDCSGDHPRDEVGKW